MKLVTLLVLMFLIFPANSWAQGQPEDTRFNLEVVIKGNPIDFPGEAVTRHGNQGMSFTAYTVAYTAMVDAIREIMTKVWALEVQGPITPQQMQELIVDPRTLYAE